jgi:hypothetical protein
MTGSLIALLVAGAVVCGLAALIAMHVVREVRRLIAGCRHQVGEIRIRLLGPGPRRDAAVLRQRLAAEVRSTGRVLATSPDCLIFQADPALVLADITTVAAALDEALASIQTFPDLAQQRAALATVEPQAAQLIDTCYSARQTMLRTAALDRDRTLHSLSTSVADQADALARYEDGRRGLTI